MKNHVLNKLTGHLKDLWAHIGPGARSSYREKKLREQQRISQLQMAILTGSIRRVK